MATANDVFFDALVRHQVGLMRLASGVSKEVNALLNATEADLVAAVERMGPGRTRRQQQRVLAAMAGIRRPAWADVDSIWEQHLREIAQAEPGFLDTALKASVPVVLETTLPPPAQLARIARTSPFEGRTMREWSRKQEADDIARLQQQVKIGMVQGETNQQIARRLVGTVRQRGTDGVTQITRNHADALSRTAVNGVANQAKRQYYLENKDVLKQELYVATLDGRTTIVCIGYDGQRYPVGEGPLPPVHWRCRSLRVGLIDDEVIGNRPAKAITRKQTLREYTQQNGLKPVKNRDALPRGHKGTYDKFERRRIREMTGQVPARTTYAEWLRKQSAEFQNDVLGPGRAKLFRAGRVKVDRFVNRAGDELTLNQLQAMDRAAFESST